MIALDQRTFDELNMLGRLAVLRPLDGFKLPRYIVGQIVEYDPITSHATIKTLYNDYVFSRVPYSDTLGAPNTWCYKQDLVTVESNDKTQESRASNKVS